ncbi:hypothetical protein O5D80_001229 [Batrachochytrium dendrobatidis]|nr:hypothetical protein O5D80_001229 [Batrachochytrium dendrobatidis]
MVKILTSSSSDDIGALLAQIHNKIKIHKRDISIQSTQDMIETEIEFKQALKELYDEHMINIRNIQNELMEFEQEFFANIDSLSQDRASVFSNMQAVNVELCTMRMSLVKKLSTISDIIPQYLLENISPAQAN